MQLGTFGTGCFATTKTSATNGEAAFPVTFKGGCTDTALLRCSVVGTNTTAVQVVARENTAAGATGGNFGFLNSSYTAAVRMDAQGNIVFGAVLKPSGKTALFYQPVTPPGSPASNVIVAGAAAPGTTATFQSMDIPSMGGDGTVSSTTSREFRCLIQ